MPDTNSPLLGLLLMGTGDDNNAWGTNCNNSVFTPLENAIAGTQTISLASATGNVTVTAAQSLYAIIELTGAPSGHVMLIVPSTSKKWSFINNTTGGNVIQVQTAGNAARNLPNGKWTDVLSDGSGALYRDDADKVGEFLYLASATAPGSVIPCSGAAISRTLFLDLFNAIGTTWGAGDGSTTFNVPQGQDTGRFLRSNSASLTVGTHQSNTNAAHTHTGNGTTASESVSHTHTGTTDAGGANSPSITGAPGAGTLGTDSQGSHTHSYIDPGHTHSFGGTYYVGTVNGGSSGGAASTPQVTALLSGVAISSSVTNITISAAGAHTHNITGAPSAGTLGVTTIPNHTHTFTTGTESVSHTHTFSFTTSGGSADGTESRPESLVGLLCIRY